MEGRRVKKRTKKQLKKHGVTVALAFVTTVFTLALGHPNEASADPTPSPSIEAVEPAPGDLVTVDANTFPVCAEEDCSDQPNQIGVWIDHDTGNQWLSIGERSYRIER
ncbi:hypothetical protein SEA_ARCHERNM_81 [Mycobacterium phage ArcherNM]|uniref:hypothetical protein n=1 Tax=Mycobacterium phage ArcherNM TaxID=1815972 RepID=UPI00078CCD00|nr:hypothetical protein BJD71_gp81 [Mycobacterium phage ArcherNM]AMS01075.1 hypothetical protein SEA_ARCHERNM_81 [Mycobacterium phage ArcherNM]